jgi:hypothetical protein
VKPHLTYLRPALKEVPERFHHFLLHNTSCWLEEYFDVLTIDISILDSQRINIPETTELIFLQIIPELGLTNYRALFDKGNIPLVLYLSMDSISPCRYAVFSFGEQLKADAYFTNDLSMGFRYPRFQKKLFYLPWFVLSKNLSSLDDSKKDIFMLLLGHNNGTYPWRNRIFPKLRSFYPVEQLAYFNKYGKAYLDLLSKAKYIPTDGGFGRILVNKHFEIPASSSCLITQPSKAVSAAGYKDMLNCIMAESFDEIVEKINLCEETPELYSSIVKKGYDLVFNHHTEKHRPQLYQWYLLNKRKTKEETIGHPSAFGPLELSASTPGESFKLDFTDDSIIIDEIDGLIESKNYYLAYQKCEFLINEYLEYSPDFLIRKVIICIHIKNLREAVKSLWRLMNFELHFSRGNKPDPIEWSMLLLSMYLANQRTAVKRMLAMFEFETEPFFNYVKFFVLSGLGDQRLASSYFAKSIAVDGKTESSHTLVPSRLEEIQKWMEDIAGRMRVANSSYTARGKRTPFKPPLYNYFFIEYYCLLYSDGNSLKNRLKSKVRLTMNLLKRANNKPVFL